jgi:hypothetical protein
MDNLTRRFVEFARTSWLMSTTQQVENSSSDNLLKMISSVEEGIEQAQEVNEHTHHQR